MSVFNIGGPTGVIVPECDIYTFEGDRYFLPGIIHGGKDYIIQTWLWTNGLDDKDWRIGIKYLPAQKILDWEAEASIGRWFNSATFEDLICNEAEEFVVENDGSGDFAVLNEMFKLGAAVPLSNREIIKWAKDYLESKKESGSEYIYVLVMHEHSGEGDVMAFFTEEALFEYAEHDIETVCRQLEEDGYSWTLVDKDNGDAEVYVPDTGIYYEWSAYQCKLNDRRNGRA